MERHIYTEDPQPDVKILQCVRCTNIEVVPLDKPIRRCGSCKCTELTTFSPEERMRYWNTPPGSIDEWLASVGKDE